jgi:hypothetical protein
MSKKSEYSVKSVSQGVASLTFIGLTFAIPIYVGYQIFKDKETELEKKNKTNPYLVAGSGLAIWYLAWKLSGMENK